MGSGMGSLFPVRASAPLSIDRANRPNAEQDLVGQKPMVKIARSEAANANRTPA